jgi:site-specific recombinase XerD
VSAVHRIRDAIDDAQQTELGRAIEACMFHALVEGKSRETVRTYSNSLRALLRYAYDHGVRTPAGLEPVLLQRWAVGILAGDTKRLDTFKGGEATVRVVLCAMRYFVRWAAAEGMHIPDLSKLKLPPLPQRVQARITADEFRALEAAITATKGHRRPPFQPVHQRSRSGAHQLSR